MENLHELKGKVEKKENRTTDFHSETEFLVVELAPKALYTFIQTRVAQLFGLHYGINTPACRGSIDWLRFTMLVAAT